MADGSRPVLISRDLAEAVRSLVDQHNASPTNRPVQGAPGSPEWLAPELYIAKTPSGGIDEMTGTTPGVAACDIYRIVLSGSTPSVEQLADLDKRVYNIDERPVYGDHYIVVHRDKIGFWLAASGFEECCDDGHDCCPPDDGTPSPGCKYPAGTVCEAWKQAECAIAFNAEWGVIVTYNRPYTINSGSKCYAAVDIVQVACTLYGVRFGYNGKWSVLYSDVVGDVKKTDCGLGATFPSEDAMRSALCQCVKSLNTPNPGGPGSSLGSHYLICCSGGIPIPGPGLPGPGNCPPGTNWIESIKRCAKCPSGTWYDPETKECYQFGTFPDGNGGVRTFGGYVESLYSEGTSGQVITVGPDGALSAQTPTVGAWTETTSTVNTTDATVTTALTLALDDDTVTDVEIWVTGRRTGGGGAADDLYAATFRDTFQRNGAGAPSRGSTGAGAPTTLYARAPLFSSVTSDVTTSGNNMIVQVTGAAGVNYSWTVKIRYLKRT